MRSEHRIIAAALLYSLAIWVLDAAIDSFLLSRESFIDALIFEPHGLYIRTLFTISLLIFSIWMSRMLVKRSLVEKALQESEEKYRSLVESTEDSIYVVDRNYRYTFVNKKHLKRLGIPEDEVLCHTYNEYHSPQETAEFIEQVNKVFETGESVQHEHKSRRDNKYFLRTLSPVRDREGNITAVTVISKQITELKRMEEDLRALSLSDDLTGLYNRRGFLTLANQQVKIASRIKKGLSLISADLDNLKTINDTFGHNEGDLALVEIADILRESFRESDIIARIGGDEFVVLLIENTAGDSEMLTSRLQKNLELHNTRRTRPYKLSLSFGVSYCGPEDACSIQNMMSSADKLMYERKKEKRKSDPNIVL